MTTLTVNLSDDVLAQDFVDECADAGTPADSLINALICSTVLARRKRLAEAQVPPIDAPDRTAISVELSSDSVALPPQPFPAVQVQP